uniref:Uncharacterized protein n=1 Tax=Meloidogyne enterolobii TaxID=390850 RepID=A0A6V7XZB5_MELEN|nr:unnamed protein product [Meloidogyne enterolobii]
MANKFILVPEDIYRGLTTSDVGEPNLDFTRHALERSKRRKESESSKNVHYNQELRRYLQLRNERENRPVKVELVNNKSKGTIIPKSNSRRASYISANDEIDNEDNWISDNSFSYYPQEPPNQAYNIVPSLSSSSNTSTTKSNQNIELDPRPTSNQALERILKNNGKRIKIKRNIKKKRKPKRKTNKTFSPSEDTVEPNSVIASQNAPLSPSPPISLEVSKRDLDSTDSNLYKRRRNSNPKQERLKEIAQEERKRKVLERKRNIKKYKVPIDQAALAQARKEDDVKRRQKLKRKFVIPEGTNLIPIKRVRGPVTKKQSENAAKSWIKRLAAARFKLGKNKWAKQKPTQEDINKFKPTLW